MSINLFLNRTRTLASIGLGLLIVAFGSSLIINNLKTKESVIAADPDDFVTTWETTQANELIKIPVYQTNYNTAHPNSYNYTINWGDGSPVQTFTDRTTPEHTYAQAGSYQVRISGTFPGWTFNHLDNGLADADENKQMAYKITALNQWGTGQWLDTKSMFAYCRYMINKATDTPNTEYVTDMSNMFLYAEYFNAPINFNTSNVTNMSRMFQGAFSFNSPININTSNVTDMTQMFYGAFSFDQDISHFDFRRVRPMVGGPGSGKSGLHNFFRNSNLGSYNLGRLFKNWLDNMASLGSYDPYYYNVDEYLETTPPMTFLQYKGITEEEVDDLLYPPYEWDLLLDLSFGGIPDGAAAYDDPDVIAPEEIVIELQEGDVITEEKLLENVQVISYAPVAMRPAWMSAVETSPDLDRNNPTTGRYTLFLRAEEQVMESVYKSTSVAVRLIVKVNPRPTTPAQPSTPTTPTTPTTPANPNSPSFPNSGYAPASTSQSNNHLHLVLTAGISLLLVIVAAVLFKRRVKRHSWNN